MLNCSKMLSVTGTFFGADLGDLLGEGAQGVELGSNGLSSGRLSIGITLPNNQLTADLGSREAWIEAVGAELGIGLALAINHGLDVNEQVGQMVFGAFATAGREVVFDGDIVIEFARAFADDDAAPAKLTFGSTLTARAEFFDRARHEDAADSAFERFGGLDNENGERSGNPQSVVLAVYYRCGMVYYSDIS